MKPTYKKPDLNAPRCRTKIKDLLAYPNKDPYDFFARLKEQHPQMQRYKNRTIAGWIHEFNKQLAQGVVDNRKGVTLPEGLGVIMTCLCQLTEKTASNNTDHNTSAVLSTTVRHYNHHSDGLTAKISYINNIPRFRFNNHQLWTFKPCRTLSRAVSAVMKTESEYRRYYIFNNWQQVLYLLRKQNPPGPSWRVLKAEREHQEALLSYDEFDLTGLWA